jgi:chitosanase
MDLTADQKRAIDSTLCIFETGRLPSPSSYATCTILADGAGVSYGKHQSTDKGGALDLVVQRYIAKNGQNAAALKPFVPYLTGNQTAAFPPSTQRPPWLVNLMNLLVASGTDPLMQKAQDEIFEEQYMNPALGHARAAGVKHALSLLVIYDTCIQSGPGAVSRMRNLFSEASPANGGDEKAWTKAYIRARQNWLLAFPNTLVQASSYRTKALMEIADADNWELKLPMVVRKVKIT